MASALVPVVSTDLLHSASLYRHVTATMNSSRLRPPTHGAVEYSRRPPMKWRIQMCRRQVLAFVQRCNEHESSICVNTIASWPNFGVIAPLRQQQSLDGGQTACRQDHLLAQWTDDAALRSTAKLALTALARTLQPAWEHVFDCCEVAEEASPVLLIMPHMVN